MRAISPRDLETRDGRSYAIRTARPADSGRVLDHALAIHSAEDHHQVADADEVGLTVERIRELIKRLKEADNSFFLLAESGGEVIGTVSGQGGRYRRVRHSAHIGISVREGWRRQGVARALMESADACARESVVLRRLTLAVFASNEAALRLYTSLGYTIEGIRRGAIRIGEEYVDELLMALDLA